MKSRVIQQALVVGLLVTIMLIASLVGGLLMPSSRAEGHASHTGTMLIAPSYQHQYTMEHEV